MVHKGTILYALYGATSGEVGISKIDGAINQAILAILPKEGYDTNFINQWLRKNKDNIIKTYLQGGQGNLSGEIVKNLHLLIPDNLAEQQAIGEFFRRLDDTIAFHQRTQKKHQNLKKSYLEKILTKNPHAWKQRTLGELAEIRRGASPRPIQDPKWFDENSAIGWLRISDVTEQNGRVYYLEQKLSIAGQKHTLVLNEPHLILSIAATVGKPVINYVPTGIHDGFIVFLNLDADMEFLYQWLEYYQGKWKHLGQSGSQVNINSELVRNLDIFIPTLPEQQAIGEFFRRLDDTIAFHQRELEKYRLLKQVFLDRLFL